jgi:hypothetical protein
LDKGWCNNFVVVLAELGIQGGRCWQVVIVQRFDCIYQGWPDFFTQGPFSVTLNVLGAANSFQTWDRYLGGRAKSHILA